MALTTIYSIGAEAEEQHENMALLLRIPHTISSLETVLPESRLLENTLPEGNITVFERVNSHRQTRKSFIMPAELCQNCNFELS